MTIAIISIVGFIAGWLALEGLRYYRIRREKKRLERIMKRYDELMAAMFEPEPE